MVFLLCGGGSKGKHTLFTESIINWEFHSVQTQIINSLFLDLQGEDNGTSLWSRQESGLLSLKRILLFPSFSFRLKTQCSSTRWRISYCQKRAVDWRHLTTPLCWQCLPQCPCPRALAWTQSPSQNSWPHTVRPLLPRTLLWSLYRPQGWWLQVSALASLQSEVLISPDQYPSLEGSEDMGSGDVFNSSIRFLLSAYCVPSNVLGIVGDTKK